MNPKRASSFFYILILMFLTGCFPQAINENTDAWVSYETIIDGQRRVTFKAPSAAKYSDPPARTLDLSLIDESTDQYWVAWFGYDPGKGSSRLSKFILGISLWRYKNGAIVESEEELVTFLDTIDVDDDPPGTFETINEHLWYHSIDYELGNTGRIGGDSYIMRYNSTHYLVIYGRYSGSLRRNPKAIENRRSIVKSFVSEFRIDQEK